MLKRKIEDSLTLWKDSTGHKPLVIMGIRQCGKTFIAQHFAKTNYKTVVYINFIKQPERITAFLGAKDVNTILLNLSAQISGVTFTPGETCFIFDEIQECPEARTSLKFFREDDNTAGCQKRKILASILCQSALKTSLKCIRWTLKNSFGPTA